MVTNRKVIIAAAVMLVAALGAFMLTSYDGDADVRTYDVGSSFQTTLTTPQDINDLKQGSVEVTYDKTVLELVSGAWSFQTNLTDFKVQDGKGVFLALHSVDITAGPVLTLEFKCIAKGTTEISVAFSFVDTKGTTINSSYKQQIEVKAPVIDYDDNVGVNVIVIEDGIQVDIYGRTGKALQDGTLEVSYQEKMCRNGIYYLGQAKSQKIDVSTENSPMCGGEITFTGSNPVMYVKATYTYDDETVSASSSWIAYEKTWNQLFG